MSEYCKDCLIKQEKIDVLESAMPDGEKLVQLAAWLDLKYPDDDSEAQEDLRRWGYGIQALKEAKHD